MQGISDQENHQIIRCTNVETNQGGSSNTGEYNNRDLNAMVIGVCTDSGASKDTCDFPYKVDSDEKSKTFIDEARDSNVSSPVKSSP